MTISIFELFMEIKCFSSFQKEQNVQSMEVDTEKRKLQKEQKANRSLGSCFKGQGAISLKSFKGPLCNIVNKSMFLVVNNYVS